MLKVSLYDFDRTIYSRDTGTSLYLFLFRKRPLLALFIPLLLVLTLLRRLHLLPHGLWKSLMLLPMAVFSLPKWNVLVEQFWQKEKQNLFPRVLEEMQKDKDRGMLVGIISASLELYLQPVYALAPCDFIIGTRVHTKGERILCRLDGPNCKEAEKVSRFHAHMAAHYPGQPYALEKMTSDSLHDLPLYKEAHTQSTVENDGSLRPGLPEAYSNDLTIK